MIRDPVATVFSMSRREWGYSLANAPLRTFSLEEHVENWCACAECLLHYANDRRTYVCQFERLTNDALRESRRLFKFLGIRRTTAFQPRPTQPISFSNSEREFIEQQTRPYLDALVARGLFARYTS